jgi:hypothetical protein
MKYRGFKRVDGLWSITDQDTGQTLSLSVPSEELATAICNELYEVYRAAYKEGYNDALNIK